MKRKWLFGFIILILTLSACAEATETPSAGDGQGEAFELYLVADAQLAGPDLVNYDLAELPLAEDPILVTDDIISYIWNNHAINLTDEAYQKMLSIFSMGMPMSGVPFVIVSHGERIYAGAFWTPASSLSFDGVVIPQPMDPAGAPLFITLGYPTEEAYSGGDPRNDARLKSALEAAGVLE